MYIDAITKIRNAQHARKEAVKIPYTNADMAVLEVLERFHFIESAAKKGRMPKRVIEIVLRYVNEKGVIGGVKLVSRPSRRVYAGYRDFMRVKQGFGLSVVSTPLGIMAGHEARKKKVGGEILFEIW